MKLFLILSLGISLSIMAKTPKELNLERSPVKMQAEGISFKPFRDMEALQIKPLESQTFISSRDQSQFVTYDPKQLWFRDHLITNFSNKAAKVEFYRIKYLMPKGFKTINSKYVVEENYRAKILKSKQDAKFFTQWFKDFNGKDSSLVDKYPKLTFSIKQKWVEMKQDENSYDFLIQSNDKRLFYLKLSITEGSKADKEKAVKDLLKSIRIDRPKIVVAKHQSSKVKPKGNVSASYQKTIEKVKQEVTNSEGWWFAQTENYILKSNLPSKSKSFAKKIQVRVELMRKMFESFIPASGKIDAVSVITVTATRAEYIKYSDAPSWSAGVWNPSRRELIVSPLEGRSKRQAEEQMMNTLHHEAFHQYIFYALQKKGTPAWFNEGHAEIFASIKLSGNKGKLVEDDNSLRTLQTFFKTKKFSLQTLIDSDYATFYKSKELNYPLSWSFVYFLRKAGDQFKKEGYDKVLDKLLYKINEGSSMAAANKHAFEGIDMAKLQENFLKFWSNRSMRSRAERNNILAK